MPEIFPSLQRPTLFVITALTLYISGTYCGMAQDKPILRIINGEPVVARRSPVVSVGLTSIEGMQLCSGSLIGRKAVLTAAHCVSPRAARMLVIIGGRPFTVRRVRIHPRATEMPDGLIVNDIALLFLSKTTRQPRLGLLVSRMAQPNDLITILGYGKDENGKVGVLREGSSVVQAVYTDFLLTQFTSSAQSNSCSGDSGGPAVLSYTDAFGKRRSGIVGTVSAGTSAECAIGEFSYYVNTQSAAVLNFLTSHVPSIRLE